MGRYVNNNKVNLNAEGGKYDYDDAVKEIADLVRVGARTNGKYYLADACIGEKVNKWAMYKPIRNSKKANITDEDRKNASYGLVTETQYDDDAMRANTLTDFEYNKPRGMDYNEPFRIRDFDGYNHDAVVPAYVYIYVPGLDSKTQQLDIPIDAEQLYIRIIYKYRTDGGAIQQTQYFANQEIPLTDIKFQGLGTGYTPLNYMKFAVTNFNSNVIFSKVAGGVLGDSSKGLEIDITSILKGKEGWPQDDDGYFVMYPRLTDSPNSHYWPTGTMKPIRFKLGGAPMNPIVASLTATYGSNVVTFAPTGFSNAAFTLNKDGSSATMIVGSSSGTVNWGTKSSPIVMNIILGSMAISNTSDYDLSYELEGLTFTYGGVPFEALPTDLSGNLVTIKGTARKNQTTSLVLGSTYRFKISAFYGTFSGAAGGSATQGRASFKPPVIRMKLGYMKKTDTAEGGQLTELIDLSTIGNCYYY
jgi:hypothetical protein